MTKLSEDEIISLKMPDIIELANEQCYNRIPRSVKNIFYIYNEIGAWFVNLAMLMTLSAMKDAEPLPSSKASLLCMTGLISSQIIAIHRLVTCGLDVQSKQLLRVLTEQVDVAIALSIDPELANKFALTLDEKAANNFWHKHISRGKLRKDILRYLEKSIGVTSAKELMAYIKQEEAILNMGIHPSLAAAQMACLPATGNLDETFSFGFLGKPTVCSERTLKYAIFYLMIYAIIGYIPEYIDVDNTGSEEKIIKCIQDYVLGGRSVIIKLSFELLKNQNSTQFNTDFDEIKTEFGW